MALATSFRPSMAGEETTTRPWTAPVGHRQPRAADVPTSTSVSQYVLDQEAANVDRKIAAFAGVANAAHLCFAYQTLLMTTDRARRYKGGSPSREHAR
jgi:hypothetical protein